MRLRSLVRARGGDQLREFDLVLCEDGDRRSHLLGGRERVVFGPRRDFLRGSEMEDRVERHTGNRRVGIGRLRAAVDYLEDGLFMGL